MTDFGSELDDDTGLDSGPDFPDEVEQDYVWPGNEEPNLSKFDTIDDFEEAEETWNIDQKVKKSMAAQPGAPQIQVPKADHDDPYGRERGKIIEEMQTHERNLAQAELSGNTELAQRERERLTMASKTLNELPETPEVTYQRDGWNTLRGQAVEKLFDPAMRNSPIFNSPGLQHDSAVLVADFNKIAGGKIALPLESEPFGDILPVRPQNMVKLELSKAQMRDFQETVYSTSNASPDEVLKASWAWVRNSGLETAAVGVIDKERKFEAEDDDGITVDRKTNNPKHMTQEQYEKWRLEGGGQDH